MTKISPTANQSLPPQMLGSLRVALVSQFPSLLDALGCDSAAVLRRAGIPRKLLENADNKIGYDSVGRLLEESIRATGMAHFGLLAGEHFSPAVALGQTIDLMRNSPTIGVALREFVLHHHLNESGAVPMLVSVSARRHALAYSVLQHDVPVIDAFYDAALVYGMQVLRLMCGKNWQPLRVNMARRRPADVAPYTRMFGEDIRFNSRVCSIEFAPGLLGKPVDGADSVRYVRLQEEMRLRVLKSNITFSDQVARAIRPMMLFGAISAPNVANLFSLHERVLRNRLAAEGTSVRELIQNARLDTAAQLLRHTELTVSEIGAAVGYSDPPSFVRAFRCRFDGVTPGAWRGTQ